MEAIARCESESSGPPEMRLTVGERILLHLLQQEGRADEYDAPLDISQDGIAAALRISRAHASVDVSKLIDHEMVEMRFRHVNGGKRLKTYHLSDDGYRVAVGLRDMVERWGGSVDDVISTSCPPQRMTSEILQRELHHMRERMETDRRRLDRLEASVEEVF